VSDTVGKINQLTETKTVELAELIPYMDERPLTDDVLEELEFDRIEVSPEESGADGDFYYYELQLFPDDVFNDIALITSDNNADKIIRLFPYDKPIFKTAGGIKTLLMAMNGE